MTPWERAAQERAQAASEEAKKPWEIAKEAGYGPDRYKGSILPFSVGPDGSARFDSNAGVLGMAKGLVEGAYRTFTLPRDAMEGKIDLDRGPKHPLEPDPTIERVTEAATYMTPISPPSASAVRPMTGREVKRNLTPSADDLIASGGAKFDAMRDMGVDYAAKSVSQLAKDYKQSLFDKGMQDIADGGAPGTHKILDQLTNSPQGFDRVGIAQLDAARRAANTIATEAKSGVDRAAARGLERRLSAFIERADPKTVVAGPAAEAARLGRSARQDYAGGKRSDTLYGIERSTEHRAAATNSGANQGNNIRSRLATLLDNKKQRPGKPIQGFTAEETALIEGVNKGSLPANATRRMGNLLGGGGGLGQLLAGAVAGVPGMLMGDMGTASLSAAGAIATGTAFKGASNALTRRALRNVDKLTRQRTPLMQERLANPPMTPVRQGKAAALARALALIEAEERAKQNR